MKNTRGFTLMEMMIAMVMGLIVVLTVTRLMASTFGTGTRTIEMTKLTQELRTALQLMSRDVRRTSYSSEAILCYANLNCATDGSVSLPGDISINGNRDCFTYLHDRNHDGNATNDGAGGFRLASVNGVGVLEIWTGNNAPNCTSTVEDWIAITNPSIVDVHTFQVDDDQSYTEVIDLNEAGNNVVQKIRKIHMQVGARLAYNPDVTRVIEETIRVRNEIVL